MPLQALAARPRRVFCALCALMTFGALPACAAGPGPKTRASPTQDEGHDYGRREDLLALAAGIAQSKGLEPAWVESVLTQARFEPAVLRYIAPPPAGTAKNWAAYRARFVEPIRLRAGVAFWRENEAALREAEARYGVPAAIVVGVIGVETLYGRHMGNFRAVDALTTLSLDFPKTARRDRSAFFRDELGQLLVLCRQQGRDPLTLMSSYAGALGMPQFMPSSWLKYAVDFDGDGHIDLHDDVADVIGSVANYLATFGWQRGMATHYAVAAPTDVTDRATLLLPDIVPTFTAAELTERGAALEAAGRQHAGPLALVELQNGDAAPSYVAGTPNFYAITRYNQSSYYALAVIELGRTVESVIDGTR